MIDITEQNSGGSAVAAINSNLQEIGSNVVVGDESCKSVSDKLNEVFGQELLDSSQSGSAWAEAVGEGFDSTGYNGLTLLHISDTHGYTTMFDKCIDLMGDDSSIDFLVVTGDMTKYVDVNYTSDTKAAINSVKSMGDKLMICPGNHDTFDNSHYGFGGKPNQVCETAWLKDCLGQNVIWGDSNNVGGYWHKDVVHDGNTIRFISIDQYEVGTTVYTGDDRYGVVYSQEQVNWFMNLLYNTPSSYYIVVLLHEPPVQSPSGVADQAALGMAATNLFVSELLTTFCNKRNEITMNLFPRIMRAYLHKENLSFTYENVGDRGGHGVLTVAKDFSQMVGEPATFLCYLGGHIHEDMCGYIPYNDWSDQLMLFITAGDSDVWFSGADDLLWNTRTGSYGWNTVSDRYAQDEPSYRINKVIFDFEREVIKVERIGNKTTALKNSTNGEDRPHGGRVRDSITFPFVKEGGES